MSLEIINQVSVTELVRHTSAIAQYERLSGSAGESHSFDYIEQQLRTFGYEISRYETEELIGYPGLASLEVLGEERLSIQVHGVSLGGATAPEGVSARAVDVGTATPDSWQTYNLEGRILVADGIPTPGGVGTAERHGALGAVFVSDELIYEMCVSPVWGSPGIDDVLATLPTVSVTKQTGEQLRELIQRSDPDLCLTTQPDTRWRTIPTLVADLSIPTVDDFVLFSGHVDAWHLGAMDNGTANATQLEIGRLLASHRDQLRRGVRLAFWSGHSHGRYAGSARYADDHWQELHDHCVCHVNVDSLGGAGATVLTRAPAMAETSALADLVIARVTGQQRTQARMSRSSDQSFWGHGIPSIFGTFSEQPPGSSTVTGRMHGGGGFGWWWHTTEDTVDKIDPHLLVRDARVYAATLWELTTRDRLPIDAGAGAADIAAVATDYHAVAKGAIDLERTAQLATTLSTRTRALCLDDEAANRLVHDLTRTLIPVAYTRRGPFDHDPALGSAPLPGLALVHTLATYNPGTDDFRRTMITLVRERNRVEAALREALHIVEAFGERS